MASGPEKHKDWSLEIAWVEIVDTLISVVRSAGGRLAPRALWKTLATLLHILAPRVLTSFPQFRCRAREQKKGTA
jgi:hypothetical protein